MSKRLFKTLVAVLTIAAAATGPARAQWTGGTYTATATENLGAITVNGNATLTINSDVTVTVTGGINVASGTLTVKGPGTLVVTGANGNDGWYDDWDAVAYPAGNGGAAISGNIIVQDGAVVTATGGAGGNAGDIEAPYGGIGGVAFAGTLTYKGGTVTATGGAGGRHKNESSASDGKAFANNVDFTQTTVEYTLTDGSNTITTISNQKTVIIIPTYTVRMAAGTEEAANWSIASGGASVPGTQVLANVMSGSELTATYSGTRKVKSVKAVKFVAVQSIVLDKQTAFLAKDSTMTLSVASVLPENAADKSYTWSSDNTSVATVNATTGVVTGMAAGTANIIATANDGSGVADTCVVTVLRSAILDGVTLLYASDYGLETWSTVVGYNPGVMYQDGDYVKLTSNDAFLCHDGHPVYVDDNAYPPFNDCQWLFLTNIDGANFIYRQGETWEQAINAGRLDNDNWSTEGGQVKYHNIQILLDSNYEPVAPTATIDPSTVVYHLGFLND